MARETPTTLAAAMTIGEARALIIERLNADGLCAADQRALLLLDVGTYLVNMADINRRRRHGIEDNGAPAEQVIRDERRLNHDWPHVVEYLAEQAG